MRVPIVVPDLDLGDEPLRLGEWAVDVGDEIEAGEGLAEIIGPGLALELPAPASGIIAELLRQPEQTVQTGEVLGWIEAAPPVDE
jgi:2-oxoglutarate dehydrogenase E2 component (dihydrolipoamide succinyltransferase)